MSRSTDEWVWPPPPRTKNSGLVANHEGACACTCACASQILQRHQQLEQQKSQQDISYTNDVSRIMQGSDFSQGNSSVFDQSASPKPVTVSLFLLLFSY